MTVKQIADAADVSENTVRRKIAELYPTKTENGKKVVLNQEEALAVMKDLRKKNFVSPNALPAHDASGGNLTMRDLEIIGAVVKGAVEGLEHRMDKIEQRIEERQALLPPPSLKTRDQINMILREHAGKMDMEFADCWRELYRQYSYRYGTNIRLLAQNRGMGTLDYIEAEGLLENLLSVALEVFGG